MIINHNMSSLFANRQLGMTNSALTVSGKKLASGMQINSAGDDPSGLAVSEKMRAQIKGLKQASENASNGISFIQSTEGFLQETGDILQRLRELSVQSANGVYQAEDRMMIQVEVSQLVDEIDRIASHAQFNGLNMLTGRFAHENGQNVVTGSMWIHLGANIDQRERLFIGTMTSAALGLRVPKTDEIVSLETLEGSNRNIAILDGAIKKVNKQRSDLGAYQNRIEHSVKGLDSAAENLQSAESRIRDVDMAQQMVEHSKLQILQSAGTSMLAQANQSTQAIVKLLG